MNYEAMTDAELIKAYESAMKSYRYWSNSQDGSDGACWEHKVKPVLAEAERRGLHLEDRN